MNIVGFIPCDISTKKIQIHIEQFQIMANNSHTKYAVKISKSSMMKMKMNIPESTFFQHTGKI